MNPTLTVDDPLADQEVSIVITLSASSQPRDERPALISVGVAEQLPVIKSGIFGDATALIHEAWTAFGVRAQVEVAALDAETIVEEEIVATADIDDEDQVSMRPTPSPPKPQAKNLSLF